MRHTTLPMESIHLTAQTLQRMGVIKHIPTVLNADVIDQYATGETFYSKGKSCSLIKTDAGYVATYEIGNHIKPRD